MTRKLTFSLALVFAFLAMPALRASASTAMNQNTPSAVRVTADRANVRERASATATILATVSRGEQLVVLGTSGNWYRVRLQPSNREGFIAMSTVEAVTASAPTAPAPTQPAPQPTRPATPAPTPAPRPAPPARPAQSARPRAAAQPTAAKPWHVRGLVGIDRFNAASKDTFSALLGSSSFTGPSIGGEVYGGMIPLGLFARVGYARFQADGERVFVVDGETFGTGIPLTVKMAPVQIAGGIRIPLGARSASRRSFLSRLTPYAGAGVVLLSYQEVSEFADDGDNDVEKLKGLSVFGGVEFGLSKFLNANVEAEFRQLKGLGAAGISEAFDEDQLGGLSLKFLIGVGR